MGLKISNGLVKATGQLALGDYVVPAPVLPVTSGLHVQWDADDAGSLVDNGGKTGRWNSSNADVYAENQTASSGASPDSSPTGRNGLFTDDTLYIVDTSSVTLSAMTVFVSYKPGDPYPLRFGGNNDTIGQVIGIEQQHPNAGNLGNDSLDIYAGSGRDRRAGLTNIAQYNALKHISWTTPGQIHSTQVYDNTTPASMANQNSDTALSVSVGPSVYSTTPIINVGTGTIPANGYFGINNTFFEILVYDRVLSAGEISSVNSYMITKWGS